MQWECKNKNKYFTARITINHSTYYESLLVLHLNTISHWILINYLLQCIFSLASDPHSASPFHSTASDICLQHSSQYSQLISSVTDGRPCLFHNLFSVYIGTKLHGLVTEAQGCEHKLLKVAAQQWQTGSPTYNFFITRHSTCHKTMPFCAGILPKKFFWQVQQSKWIFIKTRELI